MVIMIAIKDIMRGDYRRVEREEEKWLNIMLRKK